MFRFTVFLSCLVFVGSALADITLNTTINEVPLDAEHALAGSITYFLEGKDLAGASAAEPIYIRGSLDHRVVLSETLVDQASADPVLQQPINLALQVDSSTGMRCVALPDAVRVVRWVAGEPSFWLEVSQSSDEWVDDNGTPRGPTVQNPVFFILGISARLSDRENPANAPYELSNLPFNTRAYAPEEGAFEAAVSTLLCVDLRASTHTADFSLESLLTFDSVAFDHRAARGNGRYDGRAGDDLGIGFFKNHEIARVKVPSCQAVLLTPGLTTATGPARGLGTLRYQGTTYLDCEKSSQFISVRMEPGSVLRFRVTSPEAGFPDTDGAGFIGFDGDVVPPTDTAVEVRGVTLYQEIDLVYTGTEPINLVSAHLETFLTLWYAPSAGKQIHLEQTVFLSGPDPVDQAPYDGSDQHRGCAPYVVELGGLPRDIDAPATGACLLQWPEQNVSDLITLGLPCQNP